MKNKKLPYLFLTIALLLPVSVYASENGLKTETLPQIISWEDGHAYLENGELLRDGWGYDTVNPAGKYVLADENGTVRKRLESMETDAWENYTGTELSPGIIALRTTVFEGFSGSIEVTIEEQNGVTQNMTLTQNNFYKWNLSMNSGSYQIRSAVAIDKNKVYVTKFSSGFQTLPEEGLIIMHLEVMNEIARTLEEESTEAALAKPQESTTKTEESELQKDTIDAGSEDINSSQEVITIQKDRSKTIFAVLSISTLVWAMVGVLLWRKRK